MLLSACPKTCTGDRSEVLLAGSRRSTFYPESLTIFPVHLTKIRLGSIDERYGLYRTMFEQIRPACLSEWGPPGVHKRNSLLQKINPRTAGGGGGGTYVPPSVRSAAKFGIAIHSSFAHLV